MDINKKTKLLTQENIIKILDICYQQVLDGIPLISPAVEELANDYLSKYSSKECAAKAMIKNQIIKCTTSGFITGFGGFITIPVAIPANISSVIYVQMRMIACCAYMAGYDLKSDQAQTFVYACLAGVAVNGFLKQAGIRFGANLPKEQLRKFLVKY